MVSNVQQYSFFCPEFPPFIPYMVIFYNVATELPWIFLLGEGSVSTQSYLSFIETDLLKQLSCSPVIQINIFCYKPLAFTKFLDYVQHKNNCCHKHKINLKYTCISSFSSCHSGEGGHTYRHT